MGQERHHQHTIWARCSDPAQLMQVEALEQLLRQDGDAVRFICSLPPPGQDDAVANPQSQKDVRQFIFAHRPIAVLWIGGRLDQATLTPCHAVDLPVVVLDGTPQTLETMTRGWLPSRARVSLSKLHSVFVRDPEARQSFIEAGVSPETIQTSGSLDDTNAVLPYREDDRQELAQAFGTRPIWLAAAVKLQDLPMLCEAHRDAARRSHRLILIIAPQFADDGPKIAAYCKDAGLNSIRRAEGGEPEDSTQVYIADDEDGMGLWYRIAPITFLGGTFGNGALDDPFHPAALGSVTIHGPAHGKYQHRFRQLMSVNATVPVTKKTALGEAVAYLLAVDKAAAKANAGWDITSRGAGAIALVAATLQELIDGEVR